MRNLKLYVVDGTGCYALSRSMVAAYSAEQAILLAAEQVDPHYKFEFDPEDTWEPASMKLSGDVIEPGVLLHFEHGE